MCGITRTFCHMTFYLICMQITIMSYDINLLWHCSTCNVYICFDFDFLTRFWALFFWCILYSSFFYSYVNSSYNVHMYLNSVAYIIRTVLLSINISSSIILVCFQLIYFSNIIYANWIIVRSRTYNSLTDRLFICIYFKMFTYYTVHEQHIYH